MVHSSAIISCIMSLISAIIAPMPKFYHIIKDGKSEGYHVAPYVATVLNSVLGCYNFALKNEDKIFLLTNIIGFEAAMIYLVIFYIYANPLKKIWVLRHAIFFNLVLPFCIVICTYMLPARVLVVELLYAISSVFLYAAPFLSMLEIVMKKDVRYMHFLLSGFVGARAVAALAYGIYKMDIYAIVSHSMGCGFAGGQMITYFYLKPTIDDETVIRADDETVARADDETVARPRTRAAARAAAAAAALDEHYHEA